MRIFVCGGTGTLGTELVRQLYDDPENQITVFSRDELKQCEMRRRFPKARYRIGDIRDVSSVVEALTYERVDVVFHVAALKQIDSMENHPGECIKTNVLGTVNVASACVAARVPYMAFSSTDKACLPINTYGMSKALAEQYLFHLNRTQTTTQFSVFRWGNVVGSRGSVIPIFVESLRSSGRVSITDEKMTRFWIQIEEACRFFISNFATAHRSMPMIPAMKAASVTRVTEALARLLQVPSFEIDYPGPRPGEKLHECLVSSHEYCLRSDSAEQYTDQELEDLMRPYLSSVGISS